MISRVEFGEFMMRAHASSAFSQSSPSDSRPRWRVRYATIDQAEAIYALVQSGMRHYALASGLDEASCQQLTALHEELSTVRNDIENALVLVGTSDGDVVASLRLKALPDYLKEAIREVGLAHVETDDLLCLDTIPNTQVSVLPTYEPEDYFLLSRFVVDASHRANGLGAALMRAALRLSASEGKKGLFLFSAAENHALINFYRAFGFEIQSVSGSRGYARALLFAQTPALD